MLKSRLYKLLWRGNKLWRRNRNDWLMRRGSEYFGSFFEVLPRIVIVFPEALGIEMCFAPFVLIVLIFRRVEAEEARIEEEERQAEEARAAKREKEKVGSRHRRILLVRFAEPRVTDLYLLVTHTGQTRARQEGRSTFDS